MKKELETIIENQDISGLKELIEGGLDISEIKLVEVFRTIFNYELKKNPTYASLENALNTQFIQIFIDNGGDIEYTVHTKKEVVISNYLTGDQKVEKIVLSCFQFAILFYDRELIKYFVEQGAEANQEIVTTINGLSMFFQALSLEVAYNHNDIDMMQYLIGKGAIVNTVEAVGRVEDEKYEAEKLLLESGVHPNQFSSGPGVTSIKGLSSLLNDEYYHDSFKEYENYPKFIIDAIKLFVKYGADVNAGCPINDVLGSEYLEVEEVEDLFYLFLDAGMDVNNRDREGNTPLIKIVENGEFYSIRFELFEDREGKSNSFIKLRDELVLTLVKNGTDINAKNRMGMTALMLASHKREKDLVEQLLKFGADINVKSEMTAFDLTSDEEIKKMINDTRNHTPQKLIKILGNFTVDKPIKFTTHKWDFGELKKEYKDFDGYMAEVKKQFNIFGRKSSGRDSDKSELETLSSNLHKKIYTFLLETNPAEDYSWCSKAEINIGWSSLDGLKEWCDRGEKPFDFELTTPFLLDGSTDITTFGDIIELFKQEIEVRRDSNMLTNIFTKIGNSLDGDFTLTTQKLERQFYTDVEKLINTLDKIFDGIKKHTKHKMVNVIANEYDDGTIELVIAHTGSPSTLSAGDLFGQVKDGDFADIKASLTNLCDWSVEGSFEGKSFRVNYLKSNNVKDIEVLEEKPAGFTHILKFYKR